MIYTRIDTYTVILYSASIREVLSRLELPQSLLSDDNVNNYKGTIVGLGQTYVWNFNGFRIECKLSEADFLSKNSEEKINFYDVIWSWLRVHIYGEGIDFLESLHADDKNYVLSVIWSDPEYWSPISAAHKVTRCDFAFDYINYEGNEFERLRKIIATCDLDDKLTKNGRLLTGDGNSLVYSYRGGKERTIYLGSTGADRMVRIYDKKFQLTDEAGNFDNSHLPQIIKDNEVTVDSWYRVELQTRENFAERYLVSCNGDLRFVMGEIASVFDIKTADGKFVAPLHKIFLWTKRTPIIQNAKCNKPRTELSSASCWVSDIALINNMLIIGARGWDGFRDLQNEAVRKRMEAPLKHRVQFLDKINTRMSLIAMQEGLKFDDFGNIGDLVKMDDGAFYLAPFPSKEEPKGPYV